MANDIEAVRAAFLAWIRDDGYLVPSAVTDIEWDDEGLPVYYTRNDGERHYLDGEWHAWQAAMSRAALAVAPATAQPGACPVCKGSGKRGRMSFVDPSKDIVSSCDVCRGSGTLAAKESRSDDRPAKGQGGGRG